MSGLLDWVLDVLPTNSLRDLPAEEKVRIITEMGFVPTGDDHQPDCPAVFDSGMRCQCVAPATLWAQPRDVDVLRHETWDERLERARKRHYGKEDR